MPTKLLFDRFTMRTVEFFSGIGGWSYSLSRLSSSFEVVEAFDINPIANQVYKLNHLLAPNHTSIEHITVKHLNKLNADLWVMSPPCQPHTRNNTTATRDTNDPRSNAFLKLMKLLQEVSPPPSYIALENVVGFEDSNCCREFLSILSSMNYQYLQYHLTPTQFGVPNARPRYYLIASRVPAVGELDSVSSVASSTVVDSFFAPKVHSSLLHTSNVTATETTTVITPLANYLCLDMTAKETEELTVPESVVSKSASWCFDIIPCPSPTANNNPLGSNNHSDRIGDGGATGAADTAVAACFTKAYSRYIRGAGSVLLIDGANSNSSGKDAVGVDPNTDMDASAAVSATREIHATVAVTTVDPQERIYKNDWREDLCLTATPGSSSGPSPVHDDTAFVATSSTETDSPTALLVPRRKRLRYFSPRELLNLFGFPADFQFNPTADNNSTSISTAGADSQMVESCVGPVQVLASPIALGAAEQTPADLAAVPSDATLAAVAKSVGKGDKKRMKVCPEKPVTRRQCYELIGNSINVTMTAKLLEHMFRVFPLIANSKVHQQ